jgi:hypothetical protein
MTRLLANGLRLGALTSICAVTLLRCTSFSADARLLGLDGSSDVEASAWPDAALQPDDGAPDGGDGWQLVFEDSFDDVRPSVTNAKWTAHNPIPDILSLHDGGAPGSTPTSLLVAETSAVELGDQFVSDLSVLLEKVGSPSEVELSFSVRPESELTNLGLITVAGLSLLPTGVRAQPSVSVTLSLQPHQPGEVKARAEATLKPCPDAGPCLIQSSTRTLLVGRWTPVVLRIGGGGPFQVSADESDAGLLVAQGLAPEKPFVPTTVIAFAGIVAIQVVEVTTATVPLASLDAFRLRTR